jgi:transposase
MHAVTVGLDIAKSVFQVHGVDAHGNVVACRQLKRRYVLPFFRKLAPCLVGIAGHGLHVPLRWMGKIFEGGMPAAAAVAIFTPRVAAAFALEIDRH